MVLRLCALLLSGLLLAPRASIVAAEAARPAASIGIVRIIAPASATPSYWVLARSDTGARIARYTSTAPTLVSTGDWQVLVRQYRDLPFEVTAAEALTIRSGRASEVDLRSGFRISHTGGTERLQVRAEGAPQLVMEISDLTRFYFLPPGRYRMTTEKGRHHHLLIRPGSVTDVRLE